MMLFSFWNLSRSPSSSIVVTMHKKKRDLYLLLVVFLRVDFLLVVFLRVAFFLDAFLLGALRLVVRLFFLNAIMIRDTSTK